MNGRRLNPEGYIDAFSEPARWVTAPGYPRCGACGYTTRNPVFEAKPGAWICQSCVFRALAWSQIDAFEVATAPLSAIADMLADAATPAHRRCRVLAQLGHQPATMRRIFAEQHPLVGLLARHIAYPHPPPLGPEARQLAFDLCLRYGRGDCLAGLLHANYLPDDADCVCRVLPSLVHVAAKDPRTAACVANALTATDARIANAAIKAQEQLRRRGVEVVPAGNDVTATIRLGLEQDYDARVLLRFHNWLVAQRLVPEIQRAKRLHKSEAVLEIAAVLATPERLRALVDTWRHTAPAMVEALCLYVWTGERMVLNDLAKAENHELWRRDDPRQPWARPVHPDELLCGAPAAWSLLTNRLLDSLNGRIFFARLPGPLVDVFRGVLPRPPFSDLVPQREPPKSSHIDLPTGRCVGVHVAATLRFIELGGVKRSKSSGAILVSTYRQFERAVPDLEPWRFTRDPATGAADGPLSRRKAELLIEALSDGTVTADVDGAALVQRWFELHLTPAATHPPPWAAFFPLATHLDPEQRAEGAAATWTALGHVLGALPLDAWVALDNLRTYMLVNRLDTLASRLPPPSFALGYGTGWNTAFDARRQSSEVTAFLNQYHLGPLLNALSFLLNALGMVALAYEPPAESDPAPWARSRPDQALGAALAIRLTDLGAYVVGRRQDAGTVAGTGREGALILDERRLLITLKGIDPFLEFVLDEVAEPVTASVYRLAPAKILANCATREDVRKRLGKLRRALPEELPPLWQAHFAELEARAEALNPKKYVVFQVAPDSGLGAHLAADPVLTQLVLRAENRHILVAPDALPKLRKRLLELGYAWPDKDA